MKTTLLLSLLLLIISPVFAESDSTKVQELTKEVIYKDVKNVLSEIGEALKVGSEHVYGVLVKQQIVHSITNLVRYLLYIVVFYITYKIFTDEKDLADDYGDLTKRGIATIPLSIISALGVLDILITINETVSGFVNPEYGAMKVILEALK